MRVKRGIGDGCAVCNMIWQNLLVIHGWQENILLLFVYFCEIFSAKKKIAFKSSFGCILYNWLIFKKSVVSKLKVNYMYISFLIIQHMSLNIFHISPHNMAIFFISWSKNFGDHARWQLNQTLLIIRLINLLKLHA